MKTWVYHIKYGWNLARIARVMIGVGVSVLAIVRQDGLMGFWGAWLTLMPLFNLSCCGAGGCDINHENAKGKSPETDPEVSNFIEVKAKTK